MCIDNIEHFEVCVYEGCAGVCLVRGVQVCVYEGCAGVCFVRGVQVCFVQGVQVCV